MQEFDFVSASSLEEASHLLSQKGGRVIAGGTDVLPRLQRETISSDLFVDISRLDELRFIRKRKNRVEIGALTTYADLLTSPLLNEAAPALVEAAATVGCPQTRNRGTIGGNIANASPAGDTLPPLLVYEAQAQFIREGKKRALSLSACFTGPGQTILEAGDVLTGISFIPQKENEESLYLKVGNRKGMNIAVASLAVRVSFSSHDQFGEAYVALGSVAPTPLRASHVEEILGGAEVWEETVERAAEAVRDDISPISDVRATAGRREETAVVLVRRALHTVIEKRKRS